MFRSFNLPDRLIILKSVLQAMPLYLFSVMVAPKHVLKAIRNIQRNFLWGGATQARKWPLVSWGKICKEKSKGGLGLRDPLTLNNILNAKLWWRCLTEPSTPWVNIWKCKYAAGIQNQDLIRREDLFSCSIIWNSAWSQRDLIRKHSFW